MAAWEIRVIDQPPVRVEVEKGRNLATEFEAIKNEPRRFWEFWKSRRPIWHVAPNVSLHVDTVLAVLILKRVKVHHPRVIGFYQEED